MNKITWVQSQNPVAQPHLDSYVNASVAGHSVVVRPREPFVGMREVVAQVAALSSVPTLVTDLDTASEVLAAGHSQRRSDQPLLAYPTSGSTGAPKCVVYQRSHIMGHARTVAGCLGLTAGTTYVALPPTRFAYGLSIVNSHLTAEVPVTFVAAEWGLPGLVRILQRSVAPNTPVALYVLPQHTPLLLSAAIDPSRVQRIIVAGGRISGTSVRALAGRFPNMRLTNMYGQAEMGPRLSMWEGEPNDFVEGVIGRPIPGATLRVLEPRDGAARGELLASSRYAMWRYLRPPYTDVEEGPGDAGEVRTGDLATTLPNGDVMHEGRADHVLNVAGTKIDMRSISGLLEATFDPLIVRVSSRPARVAGDTIPVVEIVPATGKSIRVVDVRRALHGELGALATLFDVRLVNRLSSGESGK